MLIYLYLIDTPEEKEKFETIYYLYRLKMYYVANKILHDKYEAEDAVQSAFISIARNISKIDDAASGRTQAYVTIAARNCAYNTVRENAANVEIRYYDTINAELDDTLDNICTSETYDKIVGIINGFNDIYRDVLYLYYVEEYSAAETAKMLNRKRSTVKKQIIRGKKLLLEIIRKELGMK